MGGGSAADLVGRPVSAVVGFLITELLLLLLTPEFRRGSSFLEPLRQLVIAADRNEFPKF